MGGFGTLAARPPASRPVLLDRQPLRRPGLRPGRRRAAPLGPGAAPAEEPALRHAQPRIEIEGFRSQAERTPKGKLFVKPEDADAADPFKLVLAVPKDKLPHIYVDCGTEDRLVAASRDFAKLLMENNIPFVYGESPGGHNGRYWTREINTSMAVQYAVLRRNLAKKAD